MSGCSSSQFLCLLTFCQGADALSTFNLRSHSPLLWISSPPLLMGKLKLQNPAATWLLGDGVRIEVKSPTPIFAPLGVGSTEKTVRARNMTKLATGLRNTLKWFWCSWGQTTSACGGLTVGTLPQAEHKDWWSAWVGVSHVLSNVELGREEAGKGSLFERNIKPFSLIPPNADRRKLPKPHSSRNPPESCGFSVSSLGFALKESYGKLLKKI